MRFYGVVGFILTAIVSYKIYQLPNGLYMQYMEGTGYFVGALFAVFFLMILKGDNL